MSSLITGLIINFAKRRGLDIEVLTAEELNSHADQVWFYDEKNESEPVLIYNDQGNFLQYRTALMNGLEDMPGTIMNRQQLQKMIDYVSDTLKAQA